MVNIKVTFGWNARWCLAESNILPQIRTSDLCPPIAYLMPTHAIQTPPMYPEPSLKTAMYYIAFITLSLFVKICLILTFTSWFRLYYFNSHYVVSVGCGERVNKVIEVCFVYCIIGMRYLSLCLVLNELPRNIVTWSQAVLMGMGL